MQFALTLQIDNIQRFIITRFKPYRPKETLLNHNIYTSRNQNWS